MARRTEADRRQEHEDAKARAWDSFSKKLGLVNSFGEAKALCGETPPPDAPGRTFYSNFAFFLGNFTIPNGSNRAERALYLALIVRLDAAGELKPGARQTIEEAFRRASGGR
jgi:hypothetical protein